MDQSQLSSWSVALIGFGEVGQTFAAAILPRVSHVYVCDVQFSTKRELLDKAVQSGFTPCVSPEELPKGVNLILSLVNSAASLQVANAAVRALSPGALYIDLTTSTPHAKQTSAAGIEQAGARYVDGAIMGTVATEQKRVPILLSGPHAPHAEAVMRQAGFNCQSTELAVGGASSIKLLRSIFMKGLEALVFETMATAVHYEVSREVMKSIADTMNNNEFSRFAEALITTHAIHRHRRSKEIGDSRKLMRDVNIAGPVTDGVVEFFEWSTQQQLEGGSEAQQDAFALLSQYVMRMKEAGEQ